MAQAYSSPDDFREHKSHWGAWLFLGIVLIILGIFALSSVVAASNFTILLLGWLLIIAGIVQFFSIFFASQGRFSSALLGILYAVIGIMIVSNAAVSLATLTLLLAIVWTVSGLVKTIAAMFDSGSNKGWRIFGGLVTFLLGLLIWMGWPESSLFVFGLFLGIELIIAGVITSAGALGLRKTQKEAF